MTANQSGERKPTGINRSMFGAAEVRTRRLPCFARSCPLLPRRSRPCRGLRARDCGEVTRERRRAANADSDLPEVKQRMPHTQSVGAAHRNGAKSRACDADQKRRYDQSAGKASMISRSRWLRRRARQLFRERVFSSLDLIVFDRCCGRNIGDPPVEPCRTKVGSGLGTSDRSLS